MKLDSRIKEGKRPLTCLDVEQARKFEGKLCLFSSSFVNYKNIREYSKYPQYTGILAIKDKFDNLESEESPYRNGNDGYLYEFILPLEWVEEPEKYRPYRLREFLHKFKFGAAIYIRPKNSKTNEERMVIFSEYRTELCKDESNNAESVCLTGIEHHLKSVVCLGIREYYLTTLFDNYEYFDGKEWKTFGVEE